MPRLSNVVSSLAPQPIRSEEPISFSIPPWEVHEPQALSTATCPILRFGGPFDRFYLFAMYGIVVIDLCWVPFLVSFASYGYIWDFIVGTPFLWMDITLNVVYLTGALKELRTSAVDLVAGREYVHPRDILWFRLRSVLWWSDIISVAGGLWHILDCTELCLVRVLRFWRLSNTSDDTYELHVAKLSGGPLASLIELIISIAVIIHVMACALFFAMIYGWPAWQDVFEKDPRFFGGSAGDMYLHCFSQGAAMLTGWSSPTPAREDGILSRPERLSWCFIAPFSAIFNAFIFTSLMEVFRQINCTSTMYLDGMQGMSLLMDSLNLSASLREKILRYLSYLSVQKVNALQDMVNQSLPNDLLLAVKLHVFSSIVKSPIFYDSPPRLLADMVMSLNQLVTNPGSVLFYKGDVSHELYFVIKGTVEVLIDDGSVVAHKRQGEYFGEMALVAKDHQRTATVRAQTFCVFASLTRESFVGIVCSHPPEVRDRLERLATRAVSGSEPDPDSECTPLLSERKVADDSTCPKDNLAKSKRKAKRLATASIVTLALRENNQMAGKVFGGTNSPYHDPMEFAGCNSNEFTNERGRSARFGSMGSMDSWDDDNRASVTRTSVPLSELPKGAGWGKGFKDSLNRLELQFGMFEAKLGSMQNLMQGLDARMARIESALCRPGFGGAS